MGEFETVRRIYRDVSVSRMTCNAAWTVAALLCWSAILVHANEKEWTGREIEGEREAALSREIADGFGDEWTRERETAFELTGTRGEAS